MNQQIFRSSRFQAIILSSFFMLATPLLSAASTSDQPTTQCFYKHEGIEKIPGSQLLPAKICFNQMSFEKTGESFELNIEGDPISGVFPLEKLIEQQDFIKYMTYIFSKEHTEKDQRMTVTLRVSVDILLETNIIDYTYLAAEFFVYHDEGFDTHIYYYKRQR